MTAMNQRITTVRQRIIAGGRPISVGNEGTDRRKEVRKRQDDGSAAGNDVYTAVLSFRHRQCGTANRMMYGQ